MLNQHCQKILSRFPQNRILAVDILRGLAITAMILVNNPGSWQHIYAPLRHAEWHGWTPTDVIFPLFIFIVGLVIPVATEKMRQAGMTHSQMMLKGIRRCVTLIALGWFLALFYYNFRAAQYDWWDLRVVNLRFPGVLQRIGLVYLASLAIYLYCPKRALLAVTISLLTIYSGLMLLMPYVDANGQQYVGELSSGHHFAAWFDTQVFGPAHLYQQTLPFAQDPEGLLSTLPAIASCLIGLLIGQHLLNAPHPLAQRLKHISVMAILMLCGAYVIAPWFPINKALWSPSFVLATAAVSSLLLVLCSYIADIKQKRTLFAPLLVLGANSIAFFMFAGVLARLFSMLSVEQQSLKGWIYSQLLQPYLGDKPASLLFALGFLAICYAAMYPLYRRGWFWKV